MIRLFSILAAVTALAFSATYLTAAKTPSGWETYSASGFTAAQKRGDTIVVDVYASWCPTCRAQAPILDELRKDTRTDGVRFVKVNYDKDKAFLRQHRIPRQSTIVVFKGGREVARSIAETNRTRLRKVVLDAI